MSKSSRVAAAVAAGYVLGRFKKMRMALVVGSALANDNVRQAVLGVVKQKSGGLAGSSAGQTLTQKAGSKLLDAGKAAAVSAAASRVDALTDRLASRRESLSGEDRADADQEAEASAEGEESEGEELEDEYDEPADEDEEFEDEYDEPADEDEEPEDAEEEAEAVPRSRRRGRSASPGRRSGS